MATFYREGDDLDGLLDVLDAEYPDQVHVEDVSYRRDGGVLGFFAHRKVGVHFTLSDTGAELIQGWQPQFYDEMLDRADRAEQLDRADRTAKLAAQVVEFGRPIDGAAIEESPEANVEFARMLLELAAEKAAQRQSQLSADRADPEPTTQPMPLAAPTTPMSQWPPPAEALPPAAALPPPPPPVYVPPASVAPMPPMPSGAPLPPPVAYVPVPYVAAEPLRTEPVASRPVMHRPVGAHRAPEPDEVPAAVAYTTAPTAAPSDFVPAPTSTPADPHGVAVSTAGSNPLVLRRRLVDLGVPVDWIPDGSADPYWMVGQIVEQLPVAPVPTLADGDVLVIAGPAAAALRTAHLQAARWRLGPDRVVVVESAKQARRAVGKARSSNERMILVLETDPQTDDALDVAAATDLFRELRPAQRWMVVEASWKTSDINAFIDSAATVDAIAVVGAARTMSPASVWALRAPIALVDGQIASRGAWAALLIDKLNGSV